MQKAAIQPHLLLDNYPYRDIYYPYNVSYRQAQSIMQLSKLTNFGDDILQQPGVEEKNETQKNIKR